MYEARIIFPTTKVSALGQVVKGHFNGHTVQPYIDWITRAFGGCTITTGRGERRSDTDGRSRIINEPILIVDIAMEDTQKNIAMLTRIADVFRVQFNEICVYVRLPRGEVRFVQGE